MYHRRATLEVSDPDIWRAICAEETRQEDHIELIASENYVSPAVLEAQGSCLTNKYAEGYPGKRYYGGCEYVDIVESLAIERVKELFGADYANVQPHSGSSANIAVYHALLSPGDKVLGMNLSHGGHLTHGSPVNISGKLFQFADYGIDIKTGLLDYEALARAAHAYKPKLLLGGFSAYSRIVDWQCLADIAREVGALFMVDMAHIAGLVAGGAYPSPVPVADVVTSTTHKTLRGPRGGFILAKGDDAELTKKLNSLVFPGIQGGPLMHVIAAKAVAFKEALSPSFTAYASQVVTNARAMANVIQSRGYKILSGGTDNHLMLIDLVGTNLTGKAADAALGRAHITVNKNAVPNDPQSPFITSGIRIGSAAITTRGFREEEAIQVAHWLCDVLDQPDSESTLDEVKSEVIALCERYPVYGQ